MRKFKTTFINENDLHDKHISKICEWNQSRGVIKTFPRFYLLKIVRNPKKIVDGSDRKNLMKELPDNQLVSSQDNYFETIVVLAKFFPTK